MMMKSVGQITTILLIILAPSPRSHVLSVHLSGEVLKNDLNNPDTPAYKDLKQAPKTRDKISTGRLHGQPVRCFPKDFSPAERDSITHAVFGVRNKIPRDELPWNETLQTLMDAANGNSNYGVSLRAKSVEPISAGYGASQHSYILSVLLAKEVFKNDLNNPGTPAKKDLEKRVIKTCDEIFGGKFPGQVVRCFVKEFSPADGDSATQVVFGVAFNNTISKDELPQNETLVQTLVDAANSNSNYSVNLRATSVQLISSPVSSYSTNTTTPAVMSTSATPPTTDYVSSEPTYVLSVHLPEEAFKNDLNNPDTPAYKDLEKRVLKTCDEIFGGKFPGQVVRCFVKEFSPAEGDSATQVVFGVAFNNTISKDELPQNETLVQTLVDAANSNSNYSVNLRATSVQLISSPVSSYSTNTTTPVMSTPAVMSTSATPPVDVASQPCYMLLVHLPEEAFKSDLNNTDTPAYKDLEKRVLKTCIQIFRGRYPGQVFHCIVRGFSPAEGDNTTQVIFGVVFNNTIPKDDLPRNEAIVQTLVAAANSSNSYSVKFNSSLIHIISSPLSWDNSTVAPIATPIILSSGTRQKIINVSFRSRLNTFTIELTNTSSASFTNRALMIKSQLEPYFRDKFSTYRSFTVASFRKGSVINDLKLGFDRTSVPHYTEIASVLINASSKVIGFDIEGSSISVDGIASNGINQNISLITAFCLVILSWLLSNHQ